MRAKVILSAGVIAVAVLAPAIYFHFKPDAPAPAAPSEVAATADDAPPAGTPSILKRVHAAPEAGLPTREEAPNRPELSHDDYVAQRTAQLSELGMNNDPESLKTVLSELENPEPEIRKAALNATVDFGSKDAVPTLQNEFNWATDPQEKVDIQKAIDFLQLPSLSTDDSTVSAQSSDNSASATN